MAVVNVNNLLNGKDSRWLQLEVCREFQRNKCTRPDTECKFAHPPANVEVQNGRVTACYDSIKGRCNRDKPPCKYFHPPQHLKDQLLINGRNHLALKNALLQQMGLAPGQPMVPSQVPALDVAGKLQFPTSGAAAAAAATAIALGQPQLGLMNDEGHMFALRGSSSDFPVLMQSFQPQIVDRKWTTPYLPGVPQVGNTFNPYFSAAPIMPTAAILGPDPNNPLSMAVQQTVVTQQKMPRTADRLEPSTAAAGIAALTAANAASAVDIGRKRPHDPNDDLLMMDMKTVGAFYYENFAFPGMVPYKRAAGDKSGVPVYQQSAATAYQQLLQPFVPVSCEYRLPPSSTAFSTTAATAAAFTGISLNKQAIPQTPSHSAAAAAAAVAAAASIPRYHTSTAGQLNQAFAHHFFPTLTATLRPPFSGYPPVNITNPASTHLSELLAAAQFSNLTNNNSNINNSTSNVNANSMNNSNVANTSAGSSNSSSSSNNNANNINNNSIGSNNCDEDSQPFKKLKTV